jgi:hypothetical protein
MSTFIPEHVFFPSIIAAHVSILYIFTLLKILTWVCFQKLPYAREKQKQFLQSCANASEIPRKSI